jgi:hypothetical protein
MITRTVASLTVGLSLLVATTALAHHSANAEFDTQKEFTMSGVLTKVDNVNPHSWWFFDVKGPDGKVTHWKLESQSPAGIVRQGLKIKEEMKVGDTYLLRCAPAWVSQTPDGATLGFMKAITVNGKEYLMAEF